MMKMYQNGMVDIAPSGDNLNLFIYYVIISYEYNGTIQSSNDKQFMRIQSVKLFKYYYLR